MLIRIISLVILLTLANNKIVFSSENIDFIYPKNKPSVFKKIPSIIQNKDSNIIPLEKPIIKKTETITKEIEKKKRKD